VKIHDSDERYRSADQAKEDAESPPNQLLVETVAKLQPGKALDLACGTGRNALWLAANNWDVTAVDGSQAAIDLLCRRAAERGIAIHTCVADLAKDEYPLQTASWDFIAICFYLQTSLIESAKRGVKPGGLFLVIVHIASPGDQPTAHQLRPGELKSYFDDWEILHYHEGPPNDPGHKRLSAEIVARRPSAAK